MRQKRTSKTWAAEQPDTAEPPRLKLHLNPRLAMAALLLAGAVVVVGAIRIALAI